MSAISHTDKIIISKKRKTFGGYVVKMATLWIHVSRLLLGVFRLVTSLELVACVMILGGKFRVCFPAQAP